MKNEQEFLNGLQKQLVPWMDEAEVTANKNLQKPGNFEDAREIEKQCVMFAKEVRKANKLLGKIDEASKRLARYQTTAEQQIEEQVSEGRNIFVWALESVNIYILVQTEFKQSNIIYNKSNLTAENEVQEDRECCGEQGGEHAGPAHQVSASHRSPAPADPRLLQVGGDDQVRGEGRPRLPTPDTVPEMLCHILQLLLTSASIK